MPDTRTTDAVATASEPENRLSPESIARSMNGGRARTPLKLKVFGVLCLVGCALFLPNSVIVALELARAFRHGVFLGNSALTRVLLIVDAGLLVASMVLYGVLGVRLLLNKRRGARLSAEALVVVLVAGLLATIALFGIGPAELYYLAGIAILVALLTSMDPTLSQERELQRKLRTLETQSEVEDGTLGRDATGKGYIRLDFFNLFWIFVVASVVGDVLEAVWHVAVVEPGVFQQRAGLLWGPFSPIYGFGAVLMTVALNRFHRANVAVVFLVSGLIGAAFEFFVSWFLQVAFGVVAWDYSGTFLNIDGRTNFFFMCMWGLLGVLWIKLALPRLLRLVNRIPWKLRYAITAVCALLMLVDGAMTLVALDCWYTRMAGGVPTNALEWFCAEHFDNTWMANRFQSMSMDPSMATRR